MDPHLRASFLILFLGLVIAFEFFWAWVVGFKPNIDFWVSLSVRLIEEFG